jgi:CheY-like chemotaxis protein
MASASKRHRLTILLADDDPELHETLGDVLMAEGYDVLHAHDGRRALELALSARPDLVLLDQRMPGLTGSDVLRALRDRVRAPRAVLVTASEDVASLCRSVGASFSLSKPFDVQQLLAVIAQALHEERPA